MEEFKKKQLEVLSKHFELQRLSKLGAFAEEDFEQVLCELAQLERELIDEGFCVFPCKDFCDDELTGCKCVDVFESYNTVVEMEYLGDKCFLVPDESFARKLKGRGVIYTLKEVLFLKELGEKSRILIHQAKKLGARIIDVEKFEKENQENLKNP